MLLTESHMIYRRSVLYDDLFWWAFWTFVCNSNECDDERKVDDEKGAMLALWMTSSIWPWSDWMLHTIDKIMSFMCKKIISMKNQHRHEWDAFSLSIVQVDFFTIFLLDKPKVWLFDSVKKGNKPVRFFGRRGNSSCKKNLDHKITNTSGVGSES